jgi:hypothetical protein
VKARPLLLAALAALGVAATACRSGPAAPPHIAAPSVSPPVQALRFTGGVARVTVIGAVSASFVAPLAPSFVYPSPPSELVMSWGSPGSGDGLDLQAPSVKGTAPTSDQVILAITVTAAGQTVVASSLDGECSVTLASAARGNVHGAFSCRNLATAAGASSVIDATGSFTATGCAPSVACRGAAGSQ